MKPRANLVAVADTGAQRGACLAGFDQRALEIECRPHQGWKGHIEL